MEAPSQMLENWYILPLVLISFWVLTIITCVRCWEPKVLRKMSSHYQTKEPLSDELIDKLIKRCEGCYNLWIVLNSCIWWLCDAAGTPMWGCFIFAKDSLPCSI